ncbi:heme-binding protein [Methylocystis heyeri]|nr:heme-binding protein [Methylocystis heyeri]
MLKRLMIAATAAAGVSALAGSAQASTLPATCAGLSSTQAASFNSALKAALSQAVQSGINGGLGFNMWATVVANDGTVCAVAYSGASYTDQWLASRVISAQKSATANSLSLGAVGGASSNGKLALSTANLYSATRDGGSLFGLQFSNPVDPADAYHNADGSTPNAANFGTANDPLVGRPVGGVNVFGGGLALYNNSGAKVGAVGVSGDTSCTDHMIAWQVRHILAYDFLATGGIGGVAGLGGDTAHPDNIIFDIPNNSTGTVGGNGISTSGWGHPTCLNTPNPAKLPPVR